MSGWIERDKVWHSLETTQWGVGRRITMKGIALGEEQKLRGLMANEEHRSGGEGEKNIPG